MTTTSHIALLAITMLLFTSIGCETAGQRNQIVEEKQRQADEEQQARADSARIAENWPRLRVGMDVNEVYSLLKSSPETTKARYERAMFSNIMSFGTSRIQNTLYDLEFTEGKLTKWQLKR